MPDFVAVLAAVLSITATPAAMPGAPASAGRASCGTPLPFRVAALRGPTGAERSRVAAAVGLRRYLRRKGRGAPQQGWRLLAKQGERGLFAHGGGRSFLAVATDGRAYSVLWCWPRAVRDGVDATRWRFDGPPPAPGAREVNLVVTEDACASGRPATGRVQAPAVTLGRRTVRIAVFITPPGGGNCPSNPPTRVRVRLPEPVGDRRILDAGLVPARRRG